MSVRNTVTRVPPSGLCQFTHIRRILSLGCVCLHLSTKWLNLRGSYLPPLCVHVNGASSRQKGCVPTVWAHESQSRYSKGLIPAWSLAWLLWHKVSFLLHFFLTAWSSFTPSDCYFTSSWSKELESTCPGLVTHERESINHYCFSSSFCKALSQSSTPSWHLPWLSRVRPCPTVWVTFITFSYINQRSVWQDFNPVARLGVGGFGERIDPKFVFKRVTSTHYHSNSGSSAVFT